MTNRIYTIFSMKLFCTLFLTISITSVCSGQSLQDIENIRKQYEDALKSQELQKPKDIKGAEETARSTALPDKVIYTRKEVESLIANTQKLLDRLNSLKDSSNIMPYVGYDIFEVRDTIPFWQNLPTPNDYVLGPGDEIIISLFGSIEQNTSEIINRDGQVFLKDIGTLSLIGMKISDAKIYIKNRYSKVYSTLLGQKPTTFLDVTLGELKSINIHVVGYAVYPGTHVIHPFSSVFSSLSQAGGVDLNGSLREIKVIRDGKTISSVDLYEYLYLGKSLSNVRLLDQDVIYVPPRKSTIAITGRVKTPGYYESSLSENIQDLINFSGGFSSHANKHIYLVNNNFKNQRSDVLDANELTKHVALDGDSLHVPIFHSAEEYIVLKGQVKSPGRIPYKKDTTLEELLKIDGSLQDLVFKRSMDTKNISIFRRKNSSEEIQKFSFDLSKQEEIKIQKFDQISVPPNKYFKPMKYVMVSGEVFTPGLYNVNNQKTLKDVIIATGGLTDDALDLGIEVFRDSLKVAWENMNFILENGDSLNVLKKTGTIQVVGEVNNPGYITYKKSHNAKDYILLAGGFSSFADPRDVTVIEPNGKAIPRKKVGWQHVPEGGKIVVHKKSLLGSARGPSAWETFGIISNQIGDVATALLTLMLLLNQTNTSNGG